MSSKLPSYLSAGISTMRWPLDQDSYPPLYFKPFQEMKKIRHKTLGVSCTSGPNCPCLGEASTFHDFMAHVPESIEQVVSQQEGDSRHFGLVAASLILLGNGFTDEAHCLLTPLSTPQEIEFGYGPSVYSSVSEAARSYASYVHSLVHRREGNNVGEFGMTGFANANYWSSMVLRSPGVETLPGSELRQEIARLATSYTSSASVQDWCARHQLNVPAPDDECFEARKVHELCAMVLSDRDPGLRDFAETVVETEVRVLLVHALQKAGFDIDVSEVMRKSSTATVTTG